MLNVKAMVALSIDYIESEFPAMHLHRKSSLLRYRQAEAAMDIARPCLFQQIDALGSRS